MRPRRSLLESLEFRVLFANYVVAPFGNDNNPGTGAQPWQTLQHAAFQLLPGDHVSVRAGSYQGFQMGWEFPQGGTAQAPIVWTADPGVNIVQRNNKTPDGINLEAASYVTLDGFIVTNAGGTGEIERAGIRAVQSSGVIIKNCTVVNCGTWGIYTSHSVDVLIDHNLSANNNAINPDFFNHHGIYVADSAVNPVVRNNTVYSNHGNGIHFNGDLFQGGNGVITGALVENNIIYDNGAFGGSGINMDGVQNSRVQNNLLYNNHAKGIALYQIDAGGPSTNNIVVNNTIVMPVGAQEALTIKNAAINNKVYNNILLCADPDHGAMNVSADSIPGLVSNNNAMTDRISVDDLLTFIPLSDWRTLTGQDQASFVSSESALFVNPPARNYHLSVSSPAIDAGVSTLAPINDLDALLRPAGLTYDIGAYEANATSIPVLPKAPSNLTGQGLTSRSVKLTWADKSNDEDYFRLERSSGGGGFASIALVSANVLTYTDTNLIPSTTYAYRIFAVSRLGSSAASNSTTVSTLAVTAPTGLTATPVSSSSISLAWSQIDPDGITQYRIYRGDIATFPTDIAHRIGTSAMTSFTDPNSATSDVRYYRITALGLGGVESAVSNLASAAAIPSAPVGVAALAQAAGQINLSWTEPNPAHIDHYNIYRATIEDPGGPMPYRTTTATALADPIPDASATYVYAVTAVNVAGVESARSRAVQASVNPPAPWALSGSSSGAGVNLSWNYDQPGNVAHYNIYRGTSASFALAGNLLATSSLPEYQDPTAAAGQNWYYRVSAVNFLNIESDTSGVAAVQTAPAFAELGPFGKLTITGTSSGDSLDVHTTGTLLVATRNGESVSFLAAQVRQIVVNALGGNDVLDFSVAGSVPTNFNGGSDASDTLNVLGGSFSFDEDARIATSNLTLNVAGGSVEFHSIQHLAALNLSGSGAARMTPGGGSRYLHTRGLSIGPTALLDLDDNDLLWDYAENQQGSTPVDTARWYTQVGYWAPGDPIPSGGICSGASAFGGGDTVLSIIDNQDAGYLEWLGETIDDTTIIGKYTLFGDATLDGRVDIEDFQLVQENLGASATSWLRGDLNSDGQVTGDDFSAIDANLGRSL